jgi:hypothetical protein
MKKLNFKSALLGLMCVGAFLVLSAGQTQAQSSSIGGGLYEAPAGPFVSVPEAEQRMKAEMTDIKGAMANQTPGTLAYKENFSKLGYFKSIYDHLKSGSGVGDSIAEGLEVFSTAVYGQGVTKTKMQELKDLAIAILTP